MSRIGKQIIKFNKDVTVNLTGDILVVKGPKGELKQKIHPAVSLEVAQDSIAVKVKNEDIKSERSLWGLFARLIANMVIGVTKGYERKLELNGVGYKVAVSGNKITLNVGYSHPVDYLLPIGVTATVEKNLITLTSIDKQLVGEVAAQIRKIRKPEPYKGKGIKYLEEVIRRKAGKAAKTGAK